MAEGTPLAAMIRARAPGLTPRLGLILGSGLGDLAHQVQGTAIPYEDLPGFPRASVSGHNPHLHIGHLEGVPVALFGAREHYYENGNPAAMRPALAALAALGCQDLIVTNAAGSLRADIPTGDLMLLSDHMNFNGLNPLIGEPSEARFVPMTEAHSPRLRAALRAAAGDEGLALAEGVYAWVSGPSFETPAEIRMLGRLGADAVGMSTVPEIILARFFGLNVTAISVITNMAAGLSEEKISHDHTKAMAKTGAAKLERILRRYLQKLR